MAEQVPPPARRRPRGVPHTALAALVAFLIPWIHGTAPEFLYDAAQYWGGAAALASGDGPVEPGGLTTRGVTTAGVYLVPAIATAALGPGSAVWTVLAWNAALGAVVAVALIPRLAGLFTANPASRPPALRIWVSAVLSSVVLAGFARYPLVDVWSTALALAGFYGLAVGRRWWTLSLAGIAIVVAANLRPALIAPVLLAVVVLLFLRAKQIAIALPGAALALLPQVALNVRVWGLWSPVPPETIPLSAVQARWAPYALRYDTVLFADQDPRQWFCDPDYAAQLVADETPRNQLGVIASALQHMPDSLWFLVQKTAVNLHWSLATPYENPPDPGTSLMTPLVILVSTLGLAALVLHAMRARGDRRRLVTTLGLLGFWLGALATLVFSTPETRFALPLVLVGLVGVISAVPERSALRRPSPSALVAIGCALLLAAGLFAAGKAALSHDLPPGPLADAAACAER